MSEVISHSIDAKVWAVEFMNLFGEKRDAIDEGLMIGWFANAIMNGFDEATRRERKKLDRAKTALEPFSKVFEVLKGQKHIEYIWVQSHTDPSQNVGIHINDLQAAQQVLKEMA